MPLDIFIGEIGGAIGYNFKFGHVSSGRRFYNPYILTLIADYVAASGGAFANRRKAAHIVVKINSFHAKTFRVAQTLTWTSQNQKGFEPLRHGDTEKPYLLKKEGKRSEGWGDLTVFYDETFGTVTFHPQNIGKIRETLKKRLRGQRKVLAFCLH
jgi:hypothetical protein